MSDSFSELLADSPRDAQPFTVPPFPTTPPVPPRDPRVENMARENDRILARIEKLEKKINLVAEMRADPPSRAMCAACEIL